MISNSENFVMNRYEIKVAFELVDVFKVSYFFFGNDLSGSLHGAGGIGGLLAVSINGLFYFPLYDPNGTIIAYADETGALVAAYTYDAFGQTIAQTGPMAEKFRFRFSTKYHDPETDYYYYGYRYYSPQLGRWLTRDPLEEEGGLNLYEFCKNNGICNFDPLGLLVGGLFDVESGILLLRDYDSGAQLIICAESGGKPWGDFLPVGKYEILDHPNQDSLRLDAIDKIPRNDIHDDTGRDYFRLHKPGRTIGCIAAVEQCGDCWLNMRNLIRNTSTTYVEVRSKRRWPLPSRKETIKKFGELVVVNLLSGKTAKETRKKCKCSCKHHA